MRAILLGLMTALFFLPVVADANDRGKRGNGLSQQAADELKQAGVDKYLGQFSPERSEPAPDGWTRHFFEVDRENNGPICIVGSQYSAFSKANDPKKLLIFLQGGGACWEGFAFCTPTVDTQEQPLPPAGIWAGSSPTGIENPLSDYSVVYLPYCDGSVFSGDNDDPDGDYPFGTRFHRGLQNLSAGIDLAKELFPNAQRIVVSGTSAGGVGASGFAPFLARFAFGNERQLSILNDAGPVAVNLADEAGVEARARDWKFTQFYPESCDACESGQGTEIIRWRLQNDSTIREAFYSADGDETNRFFLRVPTVEAYRSLLLTEHGALNDEFPARYKSFIRVGLFHTALQFPIFYSVEANGVPLVDWVDDFLKPGARAYREKNTKGRGPKKNSWVDLVEER